MHGCALQLTPSLHCCCPAQAGKQLEWLTGGRVRAGMHEVGAAAAGVGKGGGGGGTVPVV
jgi:hypothetical protein